MHVQTLTSPKLPADRKPAPTWRRDLTDVLLAAALLLTLALASVL